MKARSLLSISLVMALPAMAIVACVGDDPSGAEADAASPTPSTTTTVPADGATLPDTSVRPGPDAASNPDGATSPDAGDSAVTDAQLLDAADSAKPPPTCRMPGTTGGFYTRCRAAAGTVVPGGNLQNGAYVLQGAQGQNYCTAVFVFGTAEVFTENGETYMRYSVYRAAAAGDTTAPYTGTIWLTYSPATGALRAEEMCDATRKGQSRTGTIEVIGNDVTFTYANGQDVWKKQ